MARKLLPAELAADPDRLRRFEREARATAELESTPARAMAAKRGEVGPMPDLSRPPAHTLPLPELLAKLASQTNLRAVSDPAAPGGYRLVPGPFPGWATVPEWQP